MHSLNKCPQSHAPVSGLRFPGRIYLVTGGEDLWTTFIPPASGSHKSDLISLSLFFFFGLFLSFRATPVTYGGSQARGLTGQPAPQPQQRGIRVTSETYTTAHGYAGSLTHRVRPGIEPVSSRMLVGFADR